MSKKDTESCFIFAIMGFAIGAFLTLGVYVLVDWAMSDSSDEVNLRAFGSRLCESQGYEYSHRTWEKDEVDRFPVIHCRSNTTSVYDGVVVLG